MVLLLKALNPLTSVNLPSHISIWKKDGTSKKYALNFNRVKNLHGFEYNRIKEEFSRLVLPLIEQLSTYEKVELTYTLFTGSNHKSDLMNWVSVIDKFFQDTLVQAGKLPDDNYLYVPQIKAIYGGIDKSNPRVQVEIKSLL